jgi:Lysine methyltransferase
MSDVPRLQKFEFAAAPGGHSSGNVWPAACALLEYFSRDDEPTRSGLRLLELGSGTGFFALSLSRDFERTPLARRGGNVRLTVSELESGGASSRLRENIARNAPLCGLSAGQPANEEGEGHSEEWWFTKEADSQLQVRVIPLSWGAGEEGRWTGEFDLLCGSDLVYGQETAHLLCLTVKALLSGPQSPSAFIYSHSVGRWGAHGFDAVLLENLRAQGLFAAPVSGDDFDESEWEPSSRGALPSNTPRVVTFVIKIAADGDADMSSSSVAARILLYSQRCQMLLDNQTQEGLDAETLEEAEGLAAGFDGLFPSS